MFRRARLLVAYDGAAFHGFAVNPGVATVAGVLNETISLVVRQAVEVVGAGRTDAGVHGWGQVVSVDLPGTVDLGRLQHSINRMRGPSLVVREVAWSTDPQFNARFSAFWRHYRYDVLNSPVPHPFLAPTTWQVREPLDIALLNLAVDPLIGERDFASFSRKQQVAKGAPPASTTRRVVLARWREVGPERPDVLRFEIRANAFCYQMVRSIVGTLVDVGRGSIHAGDITGIMRARDRSAAGQVAPAHGLCLWEVGYPDTEPWAANN